jgi:hypothetical protein
MLGIEYPAPIPKLLILHSGQVLSNNLREYLLPGHALHVHVCLTGQAIRRPPFLRVLGALGTHFGADAPYESGRTLLCPLGHGFR